MICGLLDKHTEYFGQAELMHKLSSGRLEVVANLPEEFAQLLDAVISESPKVDRALVGLGYVTQKAKRVKYYHCNYSALDDKPDFTACGQLGPREYVTCPDRGTCRAEGILCHIPYGLTRRERDVLVLIGLGLLDKEICARLSIGQDTLRTHKDNISAKTGEYRKPALGVLAHKLNMV